MLRVLVMGSDVQSELALLQRLQSLSGLPTDSMALSYDLSDCSLMVVSNSGAMPQAARRMLARRPELTLWLLDQDGELCDALDASDAPIGKHEIGESLRRLHGIAVAPDLKSPHDFTSSMRQHLHSGVGYGVVTIDGNEMLFLDFAKGMAVPATLNRLATDRFAAWLGASFFRLQLQTTSADCFAEAAIHATRMPLAPLLWQAALRMQEVPVLIAPLDDETALHLKNWPDFRVLGNRHDDFRLCSLLLKRACTPRECSHLLGIDTSAVRAFFNAAYLSGYASQVPAADRPPEKRETSVHKSGSVLSNMWRSVRGRMHL